MPISDDGKQKLEAFKVEYQKAAERYENIYKALWTNFSYMAVVAGGILTFGKGELGVEMAGFLACVPLLFWWLASFEPMNRYADHLASHLANIERRINQLLDLTANDHADGLGHFIGYEARNNGASFIARIIRVRCIVRFFFSGFFLLAIYLGYQSYCTDLPQRIDAITAHWQANRLEVQVTGKNLKQMKELLSLTDIKMTVPDSQGNPRELTLNVSFKEASGK